jgi:hypothetical protein
MIISKVSKTKSHMCWEILSTYEDIPSHLGSMCWGAGGSNQLLPLRRPLYAFSLDACLYRDKLKLNESYPHKLVAAWVKDTFDLLD